MHAGAGEMVAEMQLRGRAATSQADHDTAAAEPPVAAAAPEGVVQADSLAVLLTQVCPTCTLPCLFQA